jgi:microcystin-dependent protein
MSGFDRFAKRWAGGGQVAPITDNNANLGLAFLGAEPPTVEIHNQIWQWNDEKDNYLFSQISQAIVAAGLPAPTEAVTTGLRDAIRQVATDTRSGIQRNATSTETQLMALNNVTVTPASLKPLIDALTLGVATSVPAGAVMAFSRPAAPAGWLVADGSSVSRSQYLNLFNAIGTTYGSVDNNSFTLPDCRGFFIRGVGNGATGLDANRVLGSKQSSANLNHGHGLTLGAIPSHSHSFTTAAGGSHTHGAATDVQGDHAHILDQQAAGGHGHNITVNAVGQHIHPANTDAQGWHGHTGITDAQGVHTHGLNNMRASNNQIVTGTTGAEWSQVGGGAYASTDAAGNHAHNLQIDANGTHAHNVGIGGAGEHSHTASTDIQGIHTHPLTMRVTGAHGHNISVAAAPAHTHIGTTDPSGALQPTGSIALTGDSESRPFNIALLYCIKI